MRGRTWVNPCLSAVGYYQHAHLFPQNLPRVFYSGIAMGVPRQLALFVGKTACWIAVSAAPSYSSAKIYRQNLHPQKRLHSLHIRSNLRHIAGDAIKLHYQQVAVDFAGCPWRSTHSHTRSNLRAVDDFIRSGGNVPIWCMDTINRCMQHNSQANQIKSRNIT